MNYTPITSHDLEIGQGVEELSEIISPYLPSHNPSPVEK